MFAVVESISYIWETVKLRIMGHTIPQSVNDEAMEYVNNLAYSINMEWCEGPCLSRWNGCFLSRMQRGVIKLPFKYEAFLDNKDIIATLEDTG